jgi:signal transduction histidine kinase
MLIWMGVFAFRPVFEIRDAMRSFGEGTRNARAPEHGPEELRLIAAQFNDMAETLERQQNNQLHFLAAVAHDLRNPLVALNLSAQILSAERASLPGKVSHLMSIIERQVHRLDRMIGDLLDRSRIEGGQLDVKMVECDARKIVRDAFDLFRSSSTKHKFVSQVPDSEVSILCDPFRIEQVLNNLISNAIKYSPAGGEISLELKPDRDHVLFQVSDHGMGIAQEEVPYIFEPFRRVRSGAEDIPGVGLGLSVVRRIVQAHSGRIEVESRVGQGTTVRVYLPVEPHKDASPLPVSSAHRL